VSRRLVDDEYLREPEALAIGVIIFGERECTGCGAALPACADYFAPDGGKRGGLKAMCRRCVRERYREPDRLRQMANRAAVRAERS
jgi:Fe-S-cluster-containing dehydrogenase component